MCELLRQTPEQQYARCYLRSSHYTLPKDQHDFQKMKIPLVIGVTPFPSVSTAPPLLDCNFRQVPHCPNCGAIVNYQPDYCQNGASFICKFCHDKVTQWGLNASPNSPLYSSSVFDTYFPESTEKETSFNENSRKIKFTPELHLLVIEKTEATWKSGLFIETIKKIKEMIMELDEGYYSVFVFNKLLKVPYITGNNKGLRIINIVDLSSDVLPTPDKIFFNLKTQKELFLGFMDILMEEEEVLIPSLILYDLITSLMIYCNKYGIPALLVTSQNEVGFIDKYREFGFKAMKLFCSFNICCVRSNDKIDYSPLSELALLANVHVSIYSQEQNNILPQTIINMLLQPNFPNIIVNGVIPSEFKIVDIKGSGLRRTNNSFLISSLSENDTIYFYLEYDVSSLNTLTQFIQFHCRYFDYKRQRIVRIMSMSFNIGDLQNVSINTDFDMFIASFVISAIDKARENQNANSAINEIKKYKSIYFDDKFAVSFFRQQPSFITCKVQSAFINAGKLLTSESFSYLMSNSPSNISLFLSPIGYSFNLNSTEMQGPFPISGYKLESGALYIKMSVNNAVILLSSCEDIEQWSQAIVSSPTNELINQACTEKVIEILSPLTSKKHPFYIQLSKCMMIQ